MPLELENLSFGYRPSLAVLREVNATFEPGELTAVVGPNGAGKTTLLRLALGLLKPTQGRVLLGGQMAGSIPARSRAGRIAFAPRNPAVAFGFLASQVVRFGVPGGPRGRRALERACRLFETEPLLGSAFESLSSGQRQTVSLTRATAQLLAGERERERFLVVDEPTSTLDPRAALTALKGFRVLVQEHGFGVVAVMHDLELAARAADSALVLAREGRVAARGPALDAMTPETLGPVFGARFGSPEGGAARLVALASLDP